MTATDLIYAYLEHERKLNRSDYTTRERGIILRRADRELPYGLDGSDDQDILDWFYRHTWSDNTRSTYDRCLRSFYRFATSERSPDPLVVDPTAFVPTIPTPKCLPRPITDQQLAVILRQAREPYRTWCILAAYGALRCVEVSRLTREHITEVGIRLLGKGRKVRVVPTHDLVWRAVRDLPPGPIARGRDGGHLHGRYVSRNTLVHLQHDLGLPGVSMHRLRHWCLSRIQRHVGDIRVTQEIAGHASPATTAVYTLVDDEQRTAAVRSLRLPTEVAETGGGRSGADRPEAPPPPPHQ